jgi:hypothetical protein
MMIPDSQKKRRGNVIKSQSNNSDGVSEVVSVILVIALMLVLTIVVYALISGQLDPKYMQKSVYIAGDSAIIPLSNLDNVLTYLPKAGDDFYLVGQKQGRGTPVTMQLLSPDGRNLTPDASGLTGSLYGKTLFIYQKPDSSNSCEYIVKDSVPPVPPGIPPMVKGDWKIQLIDDKVHVLANSYTQTFTKGTTSLPVTILQGTGAGGKSYRADCSVSNGVCGGTCPPQFNTSPCNKTYSKFSGNNYMTFPDDPTLRYTGDMTLGVSIQPTTTAPFTYTSAANWQTIVGKGKIDGTGENDNYQLSLLGDRVGFEWGDTSTIPPTHYNVLTPAGSITAGEWSQINVVVNNNGQLTIYKNGLPQTLSYYSGNIPGYISTGVQTVHLQNVGNDVTIGRQNGVPAVSLYDRGLAQQEIANNLCSG